MQLNQIIYKGFFLARKTQLFTSVKYPACNAADVVYGLQKRNVSKIETVGVNESNRKSYTSYFEHPIHQITAYFMISIFRGNISWIIQNSMTADLAPSRLKANNIYFP